MMNYYSQKMQGYPAPTEIDQNFTEELINLFVEFYRQCFNDDMGAIKKIIRPNNVLAVI